MSGGEPGRWCSALGCHTARETQQQGTPFFSQKQNQLRQLQRGTGARRGEIRADQAKPGQAGPGLLAVGLGESAGSRFSAFQFSVCNPF